ncbi:RNA-directed DNA polymerase from mobile element jockey [Trichonephila clavipes]|nr:RNA-directed DNA polymerase from mobile element jockey [Trichonephila clavipes]
MAIKTTKTGAIQTDVPLKSTPNSSTPAKINTNVPADTKKRVLRPDGLLCLLELPWSKNSTDDLKSIISTYQPACVAPSETFLKSSMTIRVRGYNCVRRDVDGDACPTGGVCLFTSHLYPNNVVTMHTSLQAVTVRIHIHSLVTVCCVYLPPNDVVPQVDLNQLVSQLSAPFILFGDFNGHSLLWRHNNTNSRGRQIEQLMSDHCLCLLNNDEKTYFHAPTRTFHYLDLAICSPSLLPLLNFEVEQDQHNNDHFPLLDSHVSGTWT